ncbi:DUF1697 domain-containing protein [Aquimarina sp. U1-2]|uniref:DUF1697 domain-containing protein n=1 Tax=Aquimarina sp. U1-2 TaxID=2823141 RepID=UPI001AEC9A96|nr:DUF1697 domain-containing protein [Aquimarina sp. U1-2]MBP2831753.1 DUF1697 domain-containing protein [Aquimarina sp. U1-2]
MKTHIALLRGINVAGQKKINMSDLKSLFEKLGLTSVTTYIQSGNVVFNSTSNNTEKLRSDIEEGIHKTFGYFVPAIVFASDSLNTIYTNNPFLKRIQNGEIKENKMYFTFMSSLPIIANLESLQVFSSGKEAFQIQENVIYLFAANGYGKTKLNTVFFEKKLNCTATTRNLKTVGKLLEISNLMT